ncbi:transcriptional regulator, Fis family [Magnetococcus marinus MC-1]|uniref:Transcriptional regulator, Fis family n=1 Tax=Magnetococcus marinus (strain ATCC BAA-1437 / JCM 17883 / MC-1) TaxID=156889 RepID=A0LCU5_MAGMM|nr:transcriptional regulator, Fis family [Magnetococcus marinus MC-1]
MRAVRLLKEVDRILAEDTRHTSRLLNHLGIGVPMTSFHTHNTQSRIPTILAQLQQGQNIALVSDAGTPGIRDPGEPLVRACIEAGITVVPLPGATAVTTALSGSGLPTDTFLFDGFAPRKEGEMKRYLSSIESQSRTVILFESPKRIVKLLERVVAVLGGARQVVVARELSKIHETFHRGRADALLDYFASHEPRGEMVVLIAPGEPPVQAPEPLLQAALARGLSVKMAAAEVAQLTGLPRKQIYEMALHHKDSTS